MSNSEQVKNWRQRTKQRIIDAMGKQCQCCGYTKCNAALELHHIDPNQKEISFGKIIAHPSAWNKIVEELRKCILVCANCHREIHHGDRDVPEKYATFDEKYLNYKQEKLYNTRCPVCGKKKVEQNKTCSYTCAQSLMGTIQWDDDLLSKMYLDDKLPVNKIAKYFDCSNNAVYKRLKKLNLREVSFYYFIPENDLKKLLFEIPKTQIAKLYNCSLKTIDTHIKYYGITSVPPVNYWQSKISKKPNEEKLKTLIWEYPLVDIAKLYNVTEASVRKWCKKYNLQTPPRGYWNRIHAGMSHQDALNPPVVEKAEIPPPLTDDEKTKIKELLDEGIAIRKIAKLTGRSRSSVTKVRDELNSLQ